MNINFHYFGIKTLACLAGFKEDEAQTIAYTSQLVDDFMPDMMYTDQRPPEFFFKHKLAGERTFSSFFSGGKYYISPLHTGIPTVSLSLLQENFHKNTIAPFHFIPAIPIEQIMTNIIAKKYDRKELRCRVCENTGDGSLIGSELWGLWLARINSGHTKPALINLGMLLHVYADTFSHEGFSGLKGWENHAEILSAYRYGRSDRPDTISPNVKFYYSLPSIGHANVGHLPDVGVFNFSYKRRKSESDNNYTDGHKRDNHDAFTRCALSILKILHGFGKEFILENAAEEIFNKNKMNLSKGIMCAHREGSSDDDENLSTDELVKHWSALFPGIKYHYSVEPATVKRSAESEMTTITDDNAVREIIQIETEWRSRFGIPDSSNASAKREDGIVRRGGTTISDELYMFMEMSYKHSVFVNSGERI